jgi:linoleoyl-CoA desaturase
MMKILDAGRIIRFTKMQNGIISSFSTILLCVFIWFITFNWAITTDFKQMKSYLKRKLSYGEAKSPKTLWTTLIITKVIYVSIWIALPIIIGITWWKVLIGFL